MTRTANGGVWSRLMQRITTEADDLDAQDLAKTTEKQGARPCSRAEPGEIVTVAGRLRSVVYTPSERSPALTAELFDGSGAVHLVWLGQRRIPGIEPGRQLTVRGRVAERGGQCTIFNPWYELRHG